MKKYDSKKFSKHFFTYGKMVASPVPKHYTALMVCFLSTVTTLIFLLGTPLYPAGITALLALVSYYFYRKWKKEMEDDMSEKLAI